MFWKHSVLIRDTWLIFSDCSNQSEMEIKEHSWSCALNSDIRRGEQGVRASVMQETPSVCYSSPFRGDSSSGKPVLTSTGWEDRPQYERQCWSGVVHVLDSNFTGYTLECANNESKMIDLWYISAPISSFLSGQQNLILPFEVIGYS